MSAPDSNFVKTPVTDILGNPKSTKGDGSIKSGGEVIPGGQKESGGVIGETVTYYDIKQK
jgi:hypothetical protein